MGKRQAGKFGKRKRETRKNLALPQIRNMKKNVMLLFFKFHLSV